MARPAELTVHRGAVLHFRSDPGADDAPSSYEYWEDGALLVKAGKIEAAGDWSQLAATLPKDCEVVDHGGALLLPGFIDTHIHFAQTDVIASGGRNLLDWLEHYTFPVEAQFADREHARAVARFFLDELISNGTTTAQVLGTVHAAATDAFFEVAQQRSMRMIAGKVLMDRNCPESLRDSAIDGERETRDLIEKWHEQDRLLYAITPRFAPTSSDQQLASAGRVATDYPSVFIHSHLAENDEEIAWVRKLFPGNESYTEVYDRFGLLRERATYAHCLHLDAQDRRRLGSSGAAAAFCPTSNLYLGSGLFDIEAADAAGLAFSLATDVGGGTSFSMLRTMGEAYKVAQMQGQRLTPLRAFYLSTLAGARALGLDDRIGSFRAGTEADFVVLDTNSTPLMKRRAAQCTTLSEKLLLLMMLGDERCVAGTYILGERVMRFS
jgi:guanine deaminase